MKKIHSALSTVTKYIAWVALLVTFVLMCLTTVDVILRKLPFIPFSILGSYDMTEMGMVVIVFFGIAYLQSGNGHVRVDMFVDKYPHAAQQIVMGIVDLIEAVFGGIMCYASFLQISTLIKSGKGTSVLRIPHWPFYIIMTIGLLLFTIFLVINGLMHFTNSVHKPEDPGGEQSVLPAS